MWLHVVNNFLQYREQATASYSKFWCIYYLDNKLVNVGFTANRNYSYVTVLRHNREKLSNPDSHESQNR